MPSALRSRGAVASDSPCSLRARSVGRRGCFSRGDATDPPAADRWIWALGDGAGREYNGGGRRNATTATSSVVHTDPDILSGTPVFVGTRVPIRTLLDYLEAGDPLDEFLEDFPSVTREQAVAALRLARQMLVAHANPA